MTAKKTPASKSSRKAASRKVMSKKAAAKKAVAAKSSVKKASVKKKIAAKKPIVKTASKTAAKKATARKTAVTKKTALTKKSAVKKTAAKKLLQAATKAPAAKIAAAKPASKARATPAPMTPPPLPAARKPIAPKRAAAIPAAPKPVPAVSEKAKRASANVAASTASKVKTAHGTRTKLAAGVRPPPIRPSSVSRRAARSAARGLAPVAAPVASTPDIKTRTAADEPLSELKLREHIRTSLLYVEAWLRDGAADAPLAVTELAAPAEAARAQLWRWLDREARFEDGRAMTAALLENTLHQELQLLREDMGAETFDAGLFTAAVPLFLNSVLTPDFEDFPGLQAGRPIG